ncbi:MAG: hypothetical protein LBL31_06140 [Spirochaetaceae bacterium]|jgi:hypothetical protein|nr:hypothetical protein [Spirochaetaceae bacterium]
MKKGLIVLLGAAALFFAGCEAAALLFGMREVPEEKEAVPDEKTAGGQDAVTVGGFAVQWAPSADPDGSAFDSPILGSVAFYPGMGGNGFSAPANVKAFYSKTELAGEAAFVGKSVELVDQMILDLPEAHAEETGYIYIQGTDWRKVTLTFLPLETAMPFPFQVVNYNADVHAARLASGQTDKWYRISAESAEERIIRAIYQPNKPGAVKSAGGDKTAADFTPALSAAVLKLFTVTGINTVAVRGEVLPAADAYGASSNNLIVIDVGIPNAADNGSLPLFSIPDRGLGSRGGNYAHIRLRVNTGAQLAVLADNSGYNPWGVSVPCPVGLFAGGCVEVMAGGKLRVATYDGFPLGENAVILSHYGSYLALGPASGASDYNDGEDTYFSGYLVGPAQVPGNEVRIEWDDQSTDVWLEMRQGRIATNAKLTVKELARLSHSVWFAGDATITVNGGGQLLANESVARNLDANFYANTARMVISVREYGVFDRRFLKRGAQDTDSIMTNINEVAFPIHGTTTGQLVTYINGTGISGYLIPDPE